MTHLEVSVRNVFLQTVFRMYSIRETRTHSLVSVCVGRTHTRDGAISDKC
jgi:hypothetical protein